MMFRENNNKELGEDYASMSTSNQMRRTRSTMSPRKANFTVADGRYSLTHRLGSGAFGDIYQGVDTRNNNKVAVKLEKRKVSYPQLGYESKVYGALLRGTANPVGIPRIYYYDSDAEYNILVMDLCGPSLEDLFNYCGRQLTLKTVCMLAHQMIERMEFLHEKGFIHRDIKPENFVFGLGRKGHILHIVDFGLSKLYWDKNKQTHIPYCEGKALTGTARYCSTWTHRGCEQGRRDDMEAIGFMIVYFLNGSLPWQGIVVHDQQLRTTRIGEKKNSVLLKELCRGLPNEILEYCTYCRQLKFTERPDYAYLRGLFQSLARRLGFLKRTNSDIIIDMLPEVPQGNMLTNSGENKIVTESLNVDDITARNEVEYDWMFDWFVKRVKEVHEGKPRQQTALLESVATGENSLVGLMTDSMCHQMHFSISPSRN